MDVREKLVELLREAPYNIFGNKLGNCYFYSCLELIADHLISHGVTVQEWISVEDRLPEDDEIVIICTDDNFIYAGELIGDTWFLDNDSWTATVTHWMPLPEPPKGDCGAKMDEVIE